MTGVNVNAQRRPIFDKAEDLDKRTGQSEICPQACPQAGGKMQSDMQSAVSKSMIMQMQQAEMKQLFANRCNSFKQECKATTTSNAVKNAENYSILATSHTEKIRYLRDSSGRTSLN